MNTKKLSKTLLLLSLPVMAFGALKGLGKTHAWFVPAYLIVYDGLKGEGDILDKDINSNVGVLSVEDSATFALSEEALTGQRYYNINFKAKGDATISYLGSEITTVSSEDWNEYTVRFFVSSYDESPVADVTVTEGGYIELDEVNVVLASKLLYGGNAIGELPELPHKEGYTAVAWTIDDVELSEESIWIYGASRIAYPKYEIATYTVTFEGTELEPVVVNYGDLVEEPTAPVKDGFNFIGWYKGESLFDFTTPIKEDLTLTPKYEETVEEPEEEYCDCCKHKHKHDHHHHNPKKGCDKKKDNGKHLGQNKEDKEEKVKGPKGK